MAPSAALILARRQTGGEHEVNKLTPDCGGVVPIAGRVGRHKLNK